MKFAARIGSLEASPIRRLSEGAPPDAIPLGLGEPTWDLPAPARRALAENSGACSYGPNAGLPELRRAIAAWHGADPDEVLVTCGSSGALFGLFLAFVEPGDEVLIPDPGYPAYEALARLSGAVARRYPLDAGFRLSAEAFVAALDACPLVRLAVLNAPSNPTGGGVGREDLERVARACEARGVLLVSDEVYRELHFGERCPSLRDVTTTGIVVNSVSKAWGAPGLRVGWAVGDPEILARVRVVHGYAVTAAARPCQLAALALLEASDEVLPAAREETRVRFEALKKAQVRELGWEALPPAGGFYHFMRLPDSALSDPWAFCVAVRDRGGVVVVPGDVFGPAGRPYVRLSFAASPEQVDLGVRRLAPFWRAS